MWDFPEVQKHIESCLLKLLKASASCFDILRSREPLAGDEHDWGPRQV